jgi:hypothetical protein
MMKAGLILLLIYSLTGCAKFNDVKEANAAKQAQIYNTAPVCLGKEDCAAKWDAAQLWVAKNAGYKIQTATNVIIETYNAFGSSTNLAASITKEPMGAGKYKIVAHLWCDNIFGCSPDRMDATLDFNRTVSATTNY